MQPTETGYLTFELDTITFRHVGAHARMRLGDVFWRQGMGYLLLCHPEGRRAEEFPVLATFSDADGEYIVARPLDYYADGNAYRPVVLKVMSSDEVMTLSEEEFARVDATALTAIAKPPTLDTLRKLFGLVPDLENDFKDRQLREQLTTQLFLGEHLVSEGHPVRIAEIRQTQSTVFVKLNYENSKDSYPFTLTAAPEAEKFRFAILLYPHRLTAEEDIPPLVVLQVRDPQTLAVMEPFGLQVIRRKLVQALAAARFTPISHFEQVFGPIPASD